MAGRSTHVLMSQMLQQFQLSIRSLRQNRRTKRFHDLLHGDRLRCQLIPRRTSDSNYASAPNCPASSRRCRGCERGWSYQTSPKAPIPTGCSSVYLGRSQCDSQRIKARGGSVHQVPYLLVISKVVPKICARMNSAILDKGSRNTARSEGGRGG